MNTILRNFRTLPTTANDRNIFAKAYRILTGEVLDKDSRVKNLWIGVGGYYRQVPCLRYTPSCIQGELNVRWYLALTRDNQIQLVETQEWECRLCNAENFECPRCHGTGLFHVRVNCGKYICATGTENNAIRFSGIVNEQGNEVRWYTGVEPNVRPARVEVYRAPDREEARRIADEQFPDTYQQPEPNFEAPAPPVLINRFQKAAMVRWGKLPANHELISS